MIKRRILNIGVQLEPTQGRKHGGVKIKEDGELKWGEKAFRSVQERKQFEKLRRFITNPNRLELRQSDGPTKACKDSWHETSK